MKAPFYNKTGEKTKEVVLPKEVFGQSAKPELLHQVVTSQQANKRLVLASTKDRSEVSGGGRKPWRQKGTGRARHGSIRSPIWVGGGIAFGPTRERNFKQKINHRMAQRGLMGAMFEKAKNNQVVVMEDLSLKEIKTKEAAAIIDKLSLAGSILLVISQGEREVKRAFRNLPKLRITTIDQLTAWQILSYRYLVLTKKGLSELKDAFIKKS